VGGSINGVGLGLLAEVIGPWALTAMWKYFAQAFC